MFVCGESFFAAEKRESFFAKVWAGATGIFPFSELFSHQVGEADHAGDRIAIGIDGTHRAVLDRA
jgi:hypothetical protein